jgi:hypothetical protein
LVLGAYRVALAQALPPRPRAARHWVDPSQVQWLGLLVEQARFQFSYSLGRLTGVEAPGLHTPGVFHLVAATFPGLDEAQLARGALALVPPLSDGPTRAFLVRVVCQLTLREVAAALRAPGALPMPTAGNFTVTTPLRADALFTPSPAPVVHPKVALRVRAALAQLEPALAARALAFCEWPPGPGPSSA